MLRRRTVKSDRGIASDAMPRSLRLTFLTMDLTRSCRGHGHARGIASRTQYIAYRPRLTHVFQCNITCHTTNAFPRSWPWHCIRVWQRLNMTYGISQNGAACHVITTMTTAFVRYQAFAVRTSTNSRPAIHGGPIKTGHFKKCITPVYDDVARQPAYQNVRLLVRSNIDILNVAIFKYSLHNCTETILHRKCSLI